MAGLRIFVTGASAIAATLLLAGCDGPRVLGYNTDTPYSEAEFSAAADRRDLRVSVMGNPFDAPAANNDAFANSVAAAMPSGIRVPTHFTTAPGPSADPHYRVAWAFVGPINMSGDDVCRMSRTGQVPTSAAPPASTTTKIAVFSAFCRDGSALTWAYGEMRRTTSPQDPQFLALIRTMSLELFPIVRPKQDDLNG